MKSHSNLEKKCSSCQSKEHDFTHCNLISLKINKINIIEKFLKHCKNFERKIFKRRKKKINSKKNKNLIMERMKEGKLINFDKIIPISIRSE